MSKKPLTAKTHALIDYALVAALTVLPSLLKLNKKARIIYWAEAAVLLPYIALSKQPVSVKGLIPWHTHGRIDPFNIAQFALQTATKPFRSQRKALCFNLAFTAIAGLTVLFSDFDRSSNKG